MDVILRSRRATRLNLMHTRLSCFSNAEISDASDLGVLERCCGKPSRVKKIVWGTSRVRPQPKPCNLLKLTWIIQHSEAA